MPASKPSRLIAPFFTFALLVTAWQLFVDLRDISGLVLPAPSAIASNLVDNWNHYLDDGWVTLSEAAVGFAFALTVSLLLAALMTVSRTAYDAINPMQTALRSMPVVAIAPALVLWLGFGATPKIVVAAVITFPPLLVNALTGLARVDRAAFEVLRSVGASPVEIFRHLRVPHALPYVFSAAKVCVSLALVGAVVGEWAGSSEGLGYRIVRAQSDLETTTVWGATVFLAIMGIVLTVLVSALERVVLRHHDSTDFNDRRST